MTFGLGHAETGLYAYQLIFLVCGAMSVLSMISALQS